MVFPQPNGAKHIWFAEQGSKRWAFEDGGPDLLGDTDAEIVYLCEGEWDMMALHEYKLCAVTPTGGAGAFKPEWAKRFQGKQVNILYDNDKAGRNGAANAARVLSNEAATIKVVQWNDLEEGEDLSDFLGRFSLSDLLTIVAETPAYRKEEKEKQAKKGRKAPPTLSLPCLEHNGKLYEMCFDMERTPPVWYVHSGNWNTPVFEVHLPSGMIAKPPFDDTIIKGSVKLPSAAWEADTEEQIIDEIIRYLNKYIVLSEEWLELTAYYVLLTWVYDRFSVAPYIHVYGDSGSGKTNYMMKVCNICYRGIIMGSVRAAALYRTVDLYKGTLGMDEQNWEGRQDEDSGRIMDVLLNGYKRGLPVWVTNTSKKDFLPQGFECYGPKILVSIKPFKKEALKNRCISINMTSSYLLDPDKAKEEHSDTEVEQDARGLRNILLRWRLDRYFETGYNTTGFPLALEPRVKEIFAPLISIVGDEATRKRIYGMALDLNRSLMEDRGTSWEMDIINTLMDLYKEQGNSWTTLKKITERVNEEADSTRPLTSRFISPILKGWNIERKTQGGAIKYLLDEGKLLTVGAKYGLEEP